MPASELSISRIGPESDLLLRNLFEHYIHDMAGLFDIDTQADGSYAYDTSQVWKNGYDAYLAKLGDSIAGFALVGPAVNWPGDSDAYDVHEFFVIRRYRKTGCGRRMAEFIWNEYPGKWLVRVLEANKPAVLFWRNAIANHSQGSYEEEGHVVNGRPWRFFRFVSTGIKID
jgi:predicted acetyltransferase